MKQTRRVPRNHSTAFVLAALLGVATLPGCYVYPSPYVTSVPASVDRSWDAVVGAMLDNGLGVVAEDRGAGRVAGRRGGIEIVGMVRPQADGSVRVEFSSSGATAQDPGLVDRVIASYHQRMGR